MPAGVTAAAVSEAGYVTDENLVRAEEVSVRAAAWWVINFPVVVCISSPSMT
jgi:hypothetical protein